MTKRTQDATHGAGGSRRLRMLFYLDYENHLGAGEEGHFVNSPGILPLVGWTRRRGFDVVLVTRAEELRRHLAAEAVDVVGISSMQRVLHEAAEAGREVRRTRPDVVLMLGGNAIEPFAADLAAGLFDVVVTGEAEHSLPAILRALARARGLPGGDLPSAPDLTIPGEARDAGDCDPGGALSPGEVAAVLAATFLRAVPGRPDVRAAVGVGGAFVRDPGRGRVWQMLAPSYSREQSVPENRWPPAKGVELSKPPRLLREGLSLDTAPVEGELDDLCVYPWEEFDGRNWETFELYAQRGCAWQRCSFCSVTNRQTRAMSAAKTAETIAEAAARGVRIVSFSDDMFVQRVAWNRELLQRLLKLQLPVTFRAQSRATGAFWPLLGLMQEIGFDEFALGVETLQPERVLRMQKAGSGENYLRHARQSVVRVAEAGIPPVVYMIMADPDSTLLAIASELRGVIDFAAEVYERTGVVLKYSYSLAMHPVAGSPMCEWHPYDVRRCSLGQRELLLPAEFRFRPEVTRFLTRISQATAHLPYRRENLGAFRHYLSTIASVSESSGDPDASRIRNLADESLTRLDRLVRDVDRDVDETAEELVRRSRPESLDHGKPAGFRFDFKRLGGYVAGVQRYHDRLVEGLGAE